MKKLSLVLVLFFVALGTMLAQRDITGTVTDEAGEALIGASIIVKGAEGVGTTSDIDGTYSLTVPAGYDAIVLSYTGYSTQEVALGASNVIDIQMKQGVVLNEAIVTALGISREKKTLGYAAQDVEGEELTRVKDVNFINSLSGKVAGVDIKRSSTLGGSSNVIIRGYTSLTGNNQALFVVNGVPINNDITNTSGQRTGRGGYDYGNAAMDINPEDVESLSVLRGAAATALYGSRGANGVILITTKKGSKNKDIGVSFSSGLTAGQIDKSTFIRYQKEYGPGYSAVQGWYTEGGLDIYDFGSGDTYITPVYEDASFGEKFDANRQVGNWKSFYKELGTYGQTFPFVAGENDASTFFETALTYNNSVAIDGGTDKSSFRLSYTNFDQAGIIPGSKIKKNVVSFNATHDVTDKLTAESSIQFINTKGKGRYGTGYDNRNVNQSFRQWYQVTTDMVEQKDAYDQTGKNLTWNPFGNLDPGRAGVPHYFDNYYFNVHENYSSDQRNRMIGNITLKYKINSWLDVLGRVSMDRFNETQEERIAVGSVDVPSYSLFDKEYSEENYDLFLNANKYFGTNDIINLSAMVGFNSRNTSISQVRSSTNGGLIVPNIYALRNSVSPVAAPNEYAANGRVNGIFGRVSIGYDNFLYLDLTARNDKSSTLPVDNNSYFYPSASLSLVFSELVEMDALSFGKLRLNYAQVGNDAPYYSVNDTYVLGTPFEGTALASVPSSKNNPQLKPERTKSIEAGLELGFLENRIGLDFSVYKSNTFDQIFRAASSPTTGYNSQVVNAGEIQNQGMELALNLVPVRTNDFQWKMGITWSRNTNKVIELFGDADNLQLATAQGGISVNATVGEPFGAIWGTNYVFHSNGEPIVYPHWNGGMRYRKTAAPEVIGNINPDWRGGVQNTLSYKDISLSFLIDVQKGGDFFSLDTWYGYATGVYDISAGLNDKGNAVRDLPGDGGGLPIGGVLQTGTDDNGVPISDGTVNEEYGYAADVYTSFGYVYAPNAHHIYDASFVKLRELAVTYALPSRLFENNFIGGMDLSLVGRNLWIIHKNTDYSDPEAGLSAGNISGNQSGAYPAVKEIGINLNVKF